MMQIESMKAFAKMLIERTKANFDNIVIVESGSVKGTGKSTFSMDLSMQICILMGYKYELLEVVVFDPTNEKIVERVKVKPDAWPIHVDEASKVAYKRNYNDDAQKNLIVFINVCRKHHKIIIINNPTFWGLDKDLLELADFRVTILKRGLAIVRGKISNPETMDKWLRKDTDEMIKKMCRNEMDVDGMINVLRKVPNYLFEIRYEELPQEFYKNYEELSKEAELESFYQKDEFIHKYISEALVGVLDKLKRRYGNEFSWKDIAIAVNRYLKLKNINGFVTPDRLTKVLQTLETLEFDEFIQFTNRERKKGKGTGTTTTPIVNNNNNEDGSSSAQAPVLVPLSSVSDSGAEQ